MRAFITLGLLIAMVIIMPLSGYGESYVDQDFNVSNTTITNELNNKTVDFFLPEGPRFENLTDYNKSFCSGVCSMAVVMFPITWYRIDNGEWPESWDQVKSYMPFIPVDLVSGEEYVFADYGEYNGSAPANVMIADWDSEGPDIYFANPLRDGFDCFTIDRGLFDGVPEIMMEAVGLDGEYGTATSYPNWMFAQMMMSVSSGVLSDFYVRHRELPDSPEEYLECLIINPDFDPQFKYDSPECYAGFQVLVNHSTNQSITRCQVGPPEQGWGLPTSHGQSIRDAGKPFPIDKSTADEFVCIFDEGDFFE